MYGHAGRRVEVVEKIRSPRKTIGIKKKKKKKSTGNF